MYQILCDGILETIEFRLFPFSIGFSNFCHSTLSLGLFDYKILFSYHLYSLQLFINELKSDFHELVNESRIKFSDNEFIMTNSYAMGSNYLGLRSYAYYDKQIIIEFKMFPLSFELAVGDCPSISVSFLNFEIMIALI